MDIIKTAIPGIVILAPKVFRDSRGWFCESFSLREFENAVGEVRFVQENESRSCYGVIRGLHFQKGVHAQSKLVRVTCGRVLDVAVDLRRGSPTFGKHVCCELNDENHKQLFIPKGFAHGFAVLSAAAVFQYKCDEYYTPSAESGIAWDDPDLGIDWGLPPDKVILSAKDSCRPRLKDADYLFEYNGIQA